MVGIGNHEQDHEVGGEKDPSGAPGEGFHPKWGNYGTDSGGECGVPMYNRFHMPDNGNYLWWYSYDYGMVHMIMMSTEHNFTQGSRQYEWLEDDLKKVDRSKTPWVMIGGHRAMYCSEDIKSMLIPKAHLLLSISSINSVLLCGRAGLSLLSLYVSADMLNMLAAYSSSMNLRGVKE